MYDKQVTEIVNVSPILLDLSYLNERTTSYTFSYFMPNGYKFILVDKNYPKKAPLTDFEAVIVDDYQKKPNIIYIPTLNSK